MDVRSGSVIMIIFKKYVTRIGFFLMLVGMSTAASADDYHYVNMLVGDRATGLGGAYTALSDDPSGCFYNPAGIAFAPHNSLSASANAFSLSEKKYKDALLDTGGRRIDWKQESFSILPNFFGVVRKLGNGAIGFSYAVTDSIQRRQKQSFSQISSLFADNPIDTYSININDNDETYLFGPSYAYRFSSAFSVGATMYVYYRDKEFIRNQLIIFEQGEHQLVNSYETETSWGYKPSVGLIWEPHEQVSVGLVFSKIVIATSDNEFQQMSRDTTGYTTDDFNDTNAIFFSRSENDDTNDFPLTVSVGAAWFVSPQLLFSGDLVYYEDMSERSEIVNFFVGTEYYFTDSFAVRCGVFSDYANTPRLGNNRINQTEHVDIYGADLSFTLFRGMSGITLGVSGGWGSGEAQIVANSPEIQDVEIRNMTCYVSASYSY